MDLSKLSRKPKSILSIFSSTDKRPFDVADFYVRIGKVSQVLSDVRAQIGGTR